MITRTTFRKGQVLLAVLSFLVIGTRGFAPRGVGQKHEIISPSRTKTTIPGGTIITALTSSSSASSSDGSRHAAAARPSSTRKDDTTEEEWHPIDMAQTTPQLLSALWFLIAQGSTTLVKGESSTLIFPQMQEKFSPSYLNRLMGHFDSCKDVCDIFGTKTVLVPHVRLGKMTGFTVKSYRNPDETDEDKFPYDPFWDDGVDWNHEGVDDDEEEDGSTSRSLQDYPEIVDKVPDDDDTIIATTKVWVDKMMSDMGICPFTSGPNMAGLPMGPVLYAVERCTSMEDMYARYWKEVVRVEQQSAKNLSTTLLIAPEFCLDNIELFENFSNTLTQPLAALGIEDLIQLVFFHPQWTFRDGGERSGTGAAANYARKSPWPMINILRTKQVRTAQRGIPTGLVYKQNEKTLNEIGVVKLETMLRLRDWSDIADISVNRRDMEALRVAQDFQQTGSISTRDTSFEYDSTPAANKVDSSQIEGGNLVNVLRDALDKRLGLKDGTTVTPLSGPETSVTMMASDFLLQELNRIAESSSNRNEPTARTSEAERMILQDMEPPDMDEEEELNVLFGGGGIPMGDDDEDDNFTGVNAIAFY